MAHVTTCRQRYLHHQEDEVQGFTVESCFGQSGCPNRIDTGEDLTKRLESLLRAHNLKEFMQSRVSGPLKLHHEFRVTLADCPNACSRPQIVDIGLISASLPRLSDIPLFGMRGLPCRLPGGGHHPCRVGSRSAIRLAVLPGLRPMRQGLPNRNHRPRPLRLPHPAGRQTGPPPAAWPGTFRDIFRRNHPCHHRNLPHPFQGGEQPGGTVRRTAQPHRPRLSFPLYHQDRLNISSKFQRKISYKLVLATNRIVLFRST